MTQEQQIAVDPSHSVWVSANAGSGKTRVLTDRVLRILLKGTPPHRILCLTYTKAAAAEMALRIQAQLAEWVILPEADLQKKLSTLLNRIPDAKEAKRARQLFALVADAPEGLRIQTIHSLCQSLLMRFSVEAGVSPHFRLMEEREGAALMEEVKERLFLTHRHNHDKIKLVQAIRRIANTISEHSFHEVLKELISQRSEFKQMLRNGLEAYQQNLEEAVGIKYRELTVEDLIRSHFSYSESEIQALQCLVVPMLASDKKTDRELGEKLAAWLECASRSDDNVEKWLACLLKEKGELRAIEHHSFMTKWVKDSCPQALEIMMREAQRAQAFWQARAALRNAQMSECLWHIALALAELYENLKLSRGVLDYEDLIESARNLLRRPGISAWVLFKLDGGIDHLLVDEAQDTSRAQWQIIEAIASEFFVGESAGRRDRTLFVVGDEKQSIYSFQGADPYAFAEMKHYFSQRIKDAGKAYKNVNLSLSFRSTPAVLHAVDKVFAREEARAGVAIAGGDILHQAYRKEPGRVELWPLCTLEREVENAAWRIPSEQLMPELPERVLAMRIADTIAEWLQKRRISAGDILILVQNRNRFYNFLIAALRQRQVPVAGADRLKLAEHIAIQDMLALAQFLLLPEDDLNLASLLKSPLYGISEELLFSLCYQRTGTLWERLRSSEELICKEIVLSLESLLAKADYLPPYEMFSQILEAEGGRRKFFARLGSQVNDPLNEFLSLALNYEQLHQPSIQGFVHWFRQTESEIKRDMERAKEEVRVMTVHGAKGMEAPIVFLPDTTGIPTVKERVFWHKEKQIFLWSYNASEDCEALKALKERVREESLAEYRRLLYVAMTRAEDELYLCGWLGEKKLHEDSWYALMQKGLQGRSETFPFTWKDCQEEGLRMQDPGFEYIKGRGGSERQLPVTAPVNTVPAWAFCSAPDEPNPPRPLSPSRPEGEMPRADSALVDDFTIRRGKVIHTLLEVIPEIPNLQREAAAKILLRRELPKMKENQYQQIIAEVEAILKHPDFREIFAEGSLAEVPITATLMHDGVPRVLSGQIDRLLVTQERILLLDYKTNRQVPTSQNNVPLRYRHQLESYAQALRIIYPGRTIKAAILWTSVPLLMPVDIEFSEVA